MDKFDKFSMAFINSFVLDRDFFIEKGIKEGDTGFAASCLDKMKGMLSLVCQLKTQDAFKPQEELIDWIKESGDKIYAEASGHHDPELVEEAIEEIHSCVEHLRG